LAIQKQGAVEKAICAAEKIGKEFGDYDIEECISICFGDLNDKEHKVFINTTMNKRELILDDIKVLKHQTTYFCT